MCQKKIVVIDGQGGGIGKMLVEAVRSAFPNALLIGVGTNGLASSAMLKAGATACATGENAVKFNCKDADVILGPVGILIANAMWGELTPQMALAVSESSAKKILIPIAKCNLDVVGIVEKPMQQYIGDVLVALKLYLKGEH